MNLLGSQRRLLQQTFAQVRQVPVRVSRRGHPFVHLDDMHVFPGQVLGGQGAQHLPGRATSAHGHDETAARGHGRTGIGRDDFRRLGGDRVGIGKHFYLSCELRPGPASPREE